MPTITVSTIKEGKKIVLLQSVVTKEELDKVRENLTFLRKKSSERLRKMLDSIPEINWEILRYANKHPKEEVLIEYPDHKGFINTINF